MAERHTLEERLARLAELERAPLTPEAGREMRKALAGPSNLLVARAAQLLGRSGDTGAIAPLTAAFLKLLGQPAEADKQCRAKEAIIEALQALDAADAEPYLRGIHHVQMEPVYGGRADTAASLRARCAEALARMRYHDAHFELAPLLVDMEPQPRLAAVKALVFLGGEKSELLLRMKVLTGDRQAEVLGECFTGLMTLEPEHSVAFVAGYLAADDPGIAEQAALALGESRTEEGFRALRACWEENTDLRFRKPLLLALALSRREDAFAFLLDVLRDEGRGTIVLALEAMAIFAADEKRRARIRTVVTGMRDAKVRETYEGIFGVPA